MPAPRILFVKLSSLGDVVHHLPAVTDLARRLPGAHIGWAVEEAYADLVRLHPAVAEAYPVNLRQLRAHPLAPAQWRRLAALRSTLRAGRWDYVIDTQGLIKSGIVAGFAGAPRSASMRRARASAWPRDSTTCASRCRAGGTRCSEPPARRERVRLCSGRDTRLWNRRAARAAAVGAGSAVPGAAARREPRGQALARGTLDRARAQAFRRRVHRGLSGRQSGRALRRGEARGRGAGRPAAPQTTLADAAALLAHAAAVVGVDTGLTQLAAALGRPTVGIYCATDPALTGLCAGSEAINVGGAGAAPGVEAVAEAIGKRCAAPCAPPTRSPGSPSCRGCCCASHGARAASAATSTAWGSGSGATRRSTRRRASGCMPSPWARRAPRCRSSRRSRGAIRATASCSPT